MTELWFPFVAVAAVFLGVIPAVTIAAKLVLQGVRRASGGGLHAPPSLVLLLLAAPSLAPIAWFISEGVHLAESDGGALACLWPHGTGEACSEVWWFVGALALVVSVSVVRSVTRSPRARPEGTRDDGAFGAGMERVRRVCARYEGLADLAGRVVLPRRSRHAACTRGLWSPRVELCPDYVRALDDGGLAAVLLHERAHAKSLDPLVYLLLEVALSLNPLGRWLRDDVARFKLARETHCDAAAVAWGADPVALADAIVTAARAEAPRLAACAATLAGDARAIELRIRLLLDGPSVAAACCQSRRRGLAPLALAALIAAPHGAHGPLSAIHTAAEQAVMAMGLHR